MSKNAPEVPHDLALKAPMSNDANFVAALFAEDAILMPPNDTTVYGIEEIRSWWEEYYTFFRITSAVESERDFTVAGDRAFDRISFSCTIIPKQGGARIHDDIRILTVWKLLDGAWKVSHQLWNSIKPVGSGTNRYMTRMLQKKTRRSSS
jgi:ketosteroid isomerase-like protein